MKKKLLLLVTAVTLVFSPFVSFGQAPNLGTTASFELFTVTGAVTNTNTSHITGNVGANTGAITGFGNVNGTMNSNNAATAQAGADLLLAKYQLDTVTPNFFIAPLIGNGDTLEAGVYSIDGNTTLSLNLTLNAEGNPNAVFIFKIQGAFSSSAAANVILINGAKDAMFFGKRMAQLA